MQGNNSVQYMVTSIVELDTIIYHFDKYPLIIQKWADYDLFKQAFELINIWQWHKIVNIKASINLGLSNTLIPSVIPVPRPKLKSQKSNNPQWLAGFVTAEEIRIGKSITQKLGVGIRLAFSITQHTRDVKLLQSFLG